MPATILSAVNVAVAFSTVFFLLSTLASHLAEIVSGLRDARGKTLEKQLSAALSPAVACEILADPVIRSLAQASRGAAREPQKATAPAAGMMCSYIAPTSFARAVTRCSRLQGGACAGSDVLMELKDDARDRGVAFEVAVIEWFAQFNDRIVGAYRRQITIELLAIGLALAFALDIDVVHLGQYLWSDPGATATTANAIGAEFAQIETATAVPDAHALARHGSELARILTGNLDPGAFGWQQVRRLDGSADIAWWAAKILGWILAAVATSFGAQFWFQLLRDGLKIRLVGPRPAPPDMDEKPAAEAPDDDRDDVPAAGAAFQGAVIRQVASPFAGFAEAAAPPPLLGALSSKYEVGNRGPGTVSTGVGDPGGVSYGSYQMTSKPAGGTVARFVAQLPPGPRAALDNLTPGTAAFSAAWAKLAQDDASGFFMLQHQFIRVTHYDRLCGTVASIVDISARSFALQNVVWSTAVQHGPTTTILAGVVGQFDFQGFQGAAHELDAQVIAAIYAERGRKLPDGRLAHFSSSSPQVQAGIARRFVSEQLDALQMLAQESEHSDAMTQADQYAV